MSEDAPGCNSYIAELEGIKKLVILDDGNFYKLTMIQNELESIRAIYHDYDLAYRREEFLLALSDI